MNIKSYTDIEQSRKLAEFLSIESADQAYMRIVIAGDNLNIPEEMQYRHNGNMSVALYSGVGIPCWSLAALLDILPTGKVLLHDKWNHGYKCICNNIDSYYFNNPIDACYEMILKLHKLNLL